MTLYEFNILSLKEKQAVVWDKGVFLENYVTKDIKINCYALNRFFVGLSMMQPTMSLQKSGVLNMGIVLISMLQNYNSNY